MKNYEEMSRSVLERRDKYNKRRRTRSTVIAAAACAAVAVGAVGARAMLDRNTKSFTGNSGVTLNAASAGAPQENASGDWQYVFDTAESEGCFVKTDADGNEIKTPVEVPEEDSETVTHYPMQTDLIEIEGLTDLLTVSKTPADPYSMKFTWVLDNPRQRITSLFGYDEWRGGTHSGIDIVLLNDDESKDILAALDGTVIAAYSDNSWNYGAGNFIVIDHGNGIATVYAHCGEVYVTEGQRVTAGEAIAKIGSTGYSTGERLHFEVLSSGERIDPLTLKYNIKPEPYATMSFNRVYTDGDSPDYTIDGEYVESDCFYIEIDSANIAAISEE